MPAELHKGIQLDDRFTAAIGKVQKAIDQLYALSTEFGANDHRPVAGQTNQLISAKGSLADLAQEFLKLRNK